MIVCIQKREKESRKITKCFSACTKIEAAILNTN